MTAREGSDSEPWFEDDSVLGGVVRDALGRDQIRVPKVDGCEDLREIGRGGQGVVYSAHQTATRRRVAVKVLSEAPGRTRAARLRFEREIEIVASLRDSRLVQVFAGGTADDGRPFVVMELVSGVHLDRAAPVVVARAAGFARPAADEAIALLAEVCEAMDHAHRHGVIHRDLKPSNILIDDAGRPRVLDFGLAKASGPAGEEMFATTAGPHFVGSLPWTSPEQAEGRWEAVDVRSDVYALGATIYHVVTGRPPCPLDRDLRSTLDAIAQEAPTAPSALDPRCDRDLEAVILRALEKDPADRYPTAGTLAQDLRRLLANEAIEARRENAWRALVKLARRRRRLAIAASVVAACAIAVGVTVSSLWRRAVAESRRAEGALDFFLDSIGSVDPVREGAGAKLVDALDRISTDLDRRFAEDEASRLRFRIRMRDLYVRLGRYDKALTEAEAVSALTSAADPKPPTLEFRWRWNGESERGHALYRLGRGKEGIVLVREARDRLAAAFGASDPDALQAAARAGMMLKSLGQLDEAERTLREVVAATEGASTIERGALARALAFDNLAAIAEIRGVPAEAEAPQREATRLFVLVKGENALESLPPRSNLGNLLLTLGRAREAVEILAPVAATLRERAGPRSPMTLAASHNLGVARVRAGDVDEGIRILQEVYDVRLADRGPSAPDTILTRGQLESARAEAASRAASRATSRSR